MSAAFSHASPEMEQLRASALAGKSWYDATVDEVTGRVSITVMVNTNGDEPTGFDVHFDVGDGDFASYEWAISEAEAISPASVSPVHGWVGWSDGGVAFAWQWLELGDQGVAHWGGRSPFRDAREDVLAHLECFARLAAALILMHWDETAALAYLPPKEPEQEDG